MERLRALAQPQCGLFTARQAVRAGIARSSLEYHARPGGQLERCARGLYRLRRSPPEECSHLWRAYLPVAATGALVSHVSALWLMGLHDRAPDLVHLTLPRAERWRSAPAGARLHFTASQPSGGRVVMARGLPTTPSEVAIVAAMREQGLSRELEDAAVLALLRSHTSPRRLRAEWPSTLTRALERIVSVAGREQGPHHEDRASSHELAELDRAARSARAEGWPPVA